MHFQIPTFHVCMTMTFMSYTNTKHDLRQSYSISVKEGKPVATISLCEYLLFEVDMKKEVNQSDQSHSVFNRSYLIFLGYTI